MSGNGVWLAGQGLHMSSKHSPAPWRLDGYYNDSIASTVPIEGGNGLHRSDNYRSADVRGWGWLQYRPDGKEIQDANARLIAAAPELYDTVKELLANAERGGWPDAEKRAVALLERLDNPKEEYP